MFASRSLRSVFALSLCVSATVALAGCYDLSAPDGPHREDFMTNDPSASATNADGEQPGQLAQAERSEQAARAATKAVTASESTNAAERSARDGVLLPTPAGADMSVAEYVARYIEPASPSPP
jgi:hypothetical protein